MFQKKIAFSLHLMQNFWVKTDSVSPRKPRKYFKPKAKKVVTEFFV